MASEQAYGARLSDPPFLRYGFGTQLGLVMREALVLRGRRAPGDRRKCACFPRYAVCGRDQRRRARSRAELFEAVASMPTTRRVLDRIDAGNTWTRSTIERSDATRTHICVVAGRKAYSACRVLMIFENPAR